MAWATGKKPWTNGIRIRAQAASVPASVHTSGCCKMSASATRPNGMRHDNLLAGCIK